MKAQILATSFSVVALLMPLPASGQVSNGLFWTHNGSYVETQRDTDLMGIIYVDPKPGLKKHGVRNGTVLFRGEIHGFAGTAYTFKRGCQPASYNVSGRLVKGDSGQHRMILKGAAPV